MASAVDVDLDRHRDVARHAPRREVEEQLLEQAAVLHTRRPRRSRWIGISALTATSRSDADEVDVHELALGGVALDLAGEREHALAVDVEGDQRVGPGLAGEDVLQLAGPHGDRDGFGAEAVDDGGDLALTAEAAGGARPEVGARLGGEGDVRHGGRRAFQPSRTARNSKTEQFRRCRRGRSR